MSKRVGSVHRARATRAYVGVVKGNTIVLEEPDGLSEGTKVLVTPLATVQGSPGAVLAAIDAPSHVKPEDVDELIRLIEEGKRAVRFDNPLTRKRKR